MNDIEKRARLNRIRKLRNFRPVLPPFPQGTIPEREKTNEDLWEEAQGYVPYINIQLLYLVPLFVLAIFPEIRHINIPYAVLGQRASLQELNQVARIYKKRIQEKDYQQESYQEHLHGYIYYRTPTERYYYNKEGLILRIETNYDVWRPGVSLTLNGKKAISSIIGTDK